MVSPSDFCPKLLPILIIGDNASFIAQISSVLAQKYSYLSVVDEPRVHRPDVDNECIRRYNAAKRVEAKHIIFANVADNIVESINLPKNRIIRINELSDLSKYESALSLRAEDYLDWGQDNIAIGLLTALRAGKILRYIPKGPNATEIATDSGHLVICEDQNELATIQAANYAYSLGAGLKIIPTIQEKESKQLLERLYSINARVEGETLSASERLQNIISEIRQFIGDLPKDVESLTFITSGIPWGFGYPEKPSTHLSTYPDLGIHLANALAAEQPGKPGIRVATIIEPGQVNAAEVDIVIESLCQQNTLVREYQGERAIVRTVSAGIELYPYDLLFISSHCGDTEGWRWTYNFKDSEGKDRELVVDVAVSFAPRPGEDLINVMMHQAFISLDGVAWDDPDRDKKLVVGTAMIDWQKLTRDPEELKPTKKEEIPRVYGSAAIKVYDHQLLIAPSQLASHNTPIVINNACVSWHRLAHTFTFMNARAYLGTLFEVGDTEAFEVIKLLFTKYFNKPLSVALWHAQNKVYGDSIRRPYIMTGPHFQRLRTVPGSKSNYLEQLLINLYNDHLKKLKAGEIPERFLKDWQDRINFFKYEIEALRNRRGDLSNRPSSARPQYASRLILG